MLQFVMKKQFRLVTIAVFALLVSVAPHASAHERDTFKIADKFYVLTVGSLNEPFVVDNMSGVDLRVTQPIAPGAKGSPVVGLEQTLKVELAAGDKKETLSFEPSNKAPGAYAANFIPTVQTTYSYRIFGTINSIPVDLTFACVPGEVSETAEDNSSVKVSDQITRIDKVGAFGCPAARKSMGFPEPALSSYDLDQNTRAGLVSAQTAAAQVSTSRALSIAAIIIGLFSLALAGISWKRKQVTH
jgi:hypothetical protein